MGFYRRPLVVALLAVSWFGAIACGDDDDPTDPPDAAAGEGGDGAGGAGTGGGGKGGKGGMSPVGGAGGEAGQAQPQVPGITTAFVLPLRTTESGGQETFAIVLDTQPTANVTIPLESSDEGEGTVSPASVTFTPSNWNAPKVVTVTGVDDDASDGDIAYTVEIGPAESTDSSYDGLEGDPIELTNTDDESAGITVDADPDLTTTERGGQATFSVVLNGAPTADVQIAVESDDPGEGTATPALLVFTPQNWDAPQVVTIRGVDDTVKDGAQDYSIVLAAAESSDDEYDGLNAEDVPVTNTDDETAGVTLDFGAGLLTNEDGSDATFSVSLNAAPIANVTFSLTSSDEGEGTVSPNSVTFTPDNWNAPQVATVTGVDDDVIDGPQPYQISLGTATSSDPDYSGASGGSVPVINEDDETAGVRITGAGNLRVNEDGGQVSFSVRLSAPPTASVTLHLLSSDTTEGTLSPATVVFTPVNWNAPKGVVITGVDDDVADGNQIFTIITSNLTSSDPNYQGVGVLNLTVTNVDDDSPGINVTPLEVETSEDGGDDTFSVVLNSEPTANVTIGVVSEDEDEAEVDVSMLTFTPANWDTPQVVTVTGQDDDVDDGNPVFFVQLLAADSSDLGYDGRDATDVEVTNIDDETAGITVTPEDGLITSEVGGYDTFTIVLNSEPTEDVTITLSSSDDSEGLPDPTSVTFTAGDWDIPQLVIVTGEDDDLDDDDQIYSIEVEAATSGDPAYDTMDAPDVEVTNTDEDVSGITVAPQSGLITSEDGDDDTFTIVLDSEPTADVTIDLSSSDPTEGTPDPATVTFTADDWDTPQLITVNGEDDSDDDGDLTYTIEVLAAESTDLNYNTMDAPDVGVTNEDDDAATPGSITVSPTSGLFTWDCCGIFASFTVVLDSLPTADVTISLMGSGPVTLSAPSLTFTPMNWSTPQTVRAYGTDVFGANVPFTVDLLPAVSMDAGYNGVDGGQVTGNVGDI